MTQSDAGSGLTEDFEITPPAEVKVERPSTMSSTAKWDLVELLGLIAAVFALASWLVRTHVIDSVQSQQQQIAVVQQLRSTERFLEDIQRSIQNQAKSSIRIEDGFDRLALYLAPEESKDRTGRLIALLRAMEEEQWAQNWTEDVLSWHSRFNRLQSLLNLVTLPQETAEVVLTKWMRLEDIVQNLLRIRAEFQEEKQAITGMRTFDAKGIADQPFVPELIRAFERHGQRIRQIHVYAFDTYRGTGAIESELIKLLEEKLDRTKATKDRAETFAYVFFVLSAVLGIASKGAKIRKKEESA